MEDEKQETKDRIKASRAICKAAAKIFKIVKERLIFLPSLEPKLNTPSSSVFQT